MSVLNHEVIKFPPNNVQSNLQLRGNQLRENKLGCINFQKQFSSQSTWTSLKYLLELDFAAQYMVLENYITAEKR